MAAIGEGSRQTARNILSQSIRCGRVCCTKAHAPILAGDEPNGISPEKLRRDLPVRWEEQRARWG